MRQILTHLGKKLVWLSLCLTLPIMAAMCTKPLRAQAVYAGHLSHTALWAGGECSGFSASFPYQSGERIYGCGLTANLRWAFHWDVEGSARWLSFNTYAGATERTLLIGPRYTIVRYHGIEPYGKFLVGDGTIHYPYSVGTDSYLTLAPGGGVKLRFSPWLNVHAEYEYQFWLNSPGFTNEPKHSLHPNGINIGVTFKVWPFKSE
jgi:hypothetical protein